MEDELVYLETYRVMGEADVPIDSSTYLNE
jgi:hypothetical protein